MDYNKLKEAVITEIDKLAEEMKAVAKAIHEKPEIGYQEYEASRLLCGFLEKNDFKVKRNIAGMETAFAASYPEKADGPTIALLAEYDALPGLGHGCGHNLIGTASVGAAVGLSKVLPKLKGRIAVMGCPAEEAGIDNAGGKVRLIKKGSFKDIDAAFIFHPFPMTTVGGETTTLLGLEFNFKGNPAHAAGNPWDGINALDGVLLTFNAINALRQHIRDGVRIHGIITHGGDAPNIVPEKASARFFLRTENKESLLEIIQKVKACAEGAATATGTKLEVNTFCNLYDSMKSNSVLASILEKNLNALGLSVEGRKKGKGSTDFGNVTRVVPACELGLRLGNGIVPHTREFLHAANSEEGFKVMMQGAKVLALSALDLLYSDGLLEKAKKEFEGVQKCNSTKVQKEK
ncbi:MAG: M20 family metallopeptidase [Nitrospirae bacterium]|nr:M20 family metallopeptidase [Nitrospirota bacterium]